MCRTRDYVLGDLWRRTRPVRSLTRMQNTARAVFASGRWQRQRSLAAQSLGSGSLASCRTCSGRSIAQNTRTRSGRSLVQNTSCEIFDQMQNTTRAVFASPFLRRHCNYKNESRQQIKHTLLNYIIYPIFYLRQVISKFYANDQWVNKKIDICQCKYSGSIPAAVFCRLFHPRRCRLPPLLPSPIILSPDSSQVAAPRST